MQKKLIGYNKPLYILPFDHRNTFTKALFGNIEIANLTADQIRVIQNAKQLVYEGFLYGTSLGIPKEYGAILADEQFGDAIIRKAINSKVLTAVCTEKTGQNEFDFEYGKDFPLHINKYNPDLVKVLIRYNPEGDPELNNRQKVNLKMLSDFCAENNYRFLFEMLIPPTALQSGIDKEKYETKLRPDLTVKAIAELQSFGIEVDIWKIEGMFAKSDYVNAVKQIRSGGRSGVGLIILGKADNKDHVEHWLRTGADVDGVLGFAIGRTVFLDAVKSFHTGKVDREAAVKQIGTNYFNFYKIFTTK